MSYGIETVTIPWVPELGDLMAAFMHAKDHNETFSPTDIVTMAAIRLVQANVPLSKQNVMDCAGVYVWPHVKRSPAYQDTFGTYEHEITRIAGLVIDALQDPEPSEALLRVTQQLGE